MKKGILAVLAFVSLSGCAAMITRQPVTGFLYTEMKEGEMVSSNQTGNRTGEACAQSVLGLVATGDASIEAARKAGGITQISYSDSSAKNILGIIANYCVIVHGR